MRIKKILDQHRRDFYAIYECDHCDYTCEGQGYDDDHFHQYVIPQMVCPICGKTASEDYRPLTTKYDDNQVV